MRELRLRGRVPRFRVPLRLVGWNQAEARKQDAWWRNVTMAWTTPTLVEICIGLEINGYLPAEI